MAKHVRIILEDDRAITSLHYSICTDAYGDTDKRSWSFVTLDSILKYCAPESAQCFMESLVNVSKEIISARNAKKEIAGNG